MDAFVDFFRTPADDDVVLRVPPLPADASARVAQAYGFHEVLTQSVRRWTRLGAPDVILDRARRHARAGFDFLARAVRGEDEPWHEISAPLGGAPSPPAVSAFCGDPGGPMPLWPVGLVVLPDGERVVVVFPFAHVVVRVADGTVEQTYPCGLIPLAVSPEGTQLLLGRPVVSAGEEGERAGAFWIDADRVAPLFVRDLAQRAWLDVLGPGFAPLVALVISLDDEPSLCVVDLANQRARELAPSSLTSALVTLAEAEAELAVADGGDTFPRTREPIYVLSADLEAVWFHELPPSLPGVVRLATCETLPADLPDSGEGGARAFVRLPDGCWRSYFRGEVRDDGAVIHVLPEGEPLPRAAAFDRGGTRLFLGFRSRLAVIDLATKSEVVVLSFETLARELLDDPFLPDLDAAQRYDLRREAGTWSGLMRLQRV